MSKFRKYGVTIGETCFILGIPIIVAKSTKKRVVLFNPITKQTISISHQRYHEYLRKCPIFDEANMLFMDTEEIAEYQHRLFKAEEDIKNSFLSFLSRKKWRLPHQNINYYYCAMAYVPLPISKTITRLYEFSHR